MNLISLYGDVQEHCAALLILLAGDDPDPDVILARLAELDATTEALRLAPAPTETDKPALLAAATECARLTEAVSLAAAACRERLQAAQARSERSVQAMGAYRTPPRDGDAQFIDQQR